MCHLASGFNDVARVFTVPKSSASAQDSLRVAMLSFVHGQTMSNSGESRSSCSAAPRSRKRLSYAPRAPPRHVKAGANTASSKPEPTRAGASSGGWASHLPRGAEQAVRADERGYAPRAGKVGAASRRSCGGPSRLNMALGRQIPGVVQALSFDVRRRILRGAPANPREVGGVNGPPFGDSTVPHSV